MQFNPLGSSVAAYYCTISSSMSMQTVHSKLLSKSDKRATVSADIKESVLSNPQAQVCQELLDQLREVRWGCTKTILAFCVSSSYNQLLPQKVVVIILTVYLSVLSG